MIDYETMDRVYDDSKYDEMVDDFFMMENDLDKEDFVKRYGQSTYDRMMEIYLSKKDKKCQD